MPGTRRGIRPIDISTLHIGDPMNNRILGRIVSIAVLAVMTVNAQVCEEKILYNGAGTPGQMESASRTFPEPPEWMANWGEMGSMKPPYIRLSGMKNVKTDWIGALSLSALPRNVQGGSLRLKVRTTQNAKFGVWLSGSRGTGNVVFSDIPANVTRALEIPVEKMLGAGLQRVENVWVGLFGVPVNQYTTLFIDDVSLSCTVAAVQEASVEAGSAASDSGAGFTPTNTVAMSPVRKPLCLSSAAVPASAAYPDADRKRLATSTSASFVLSFNEHRQIRESLEQEANTPAESRRLWYRNLFFVDRNRLRDSVVANPKGVFDEAVAFAAANNYSFMPLLLADVEYAYSECQDTLCSATLLKKTRLLQAGLPSSFVRGSKLKLVYDPYFVVTQKKTLPQVEICVSSKCSSLSVNNFVELEFESAGVQMVSVKLSSGGETQRQNLYVEVK